MQDPGYPKPLSDSAAETWLNAGEVVPWRQNWRNGEPVPRGDGGIQDRCLLFEQDSRPLAKPWTERDRRRVLELIAAGRAD